jgi:colicin import membrane protein
MKKITYLLILSSVLLGCSPSEVDYNLIQDRNGIAYLPNDSEPFTGKAVASYPSGQQKIVVSYENGKPSGTTSEWYANGQIKTEQHFSGEAEGRVRDWHQNGEVARDIKVLDGTFVGKNIWSVSEYRTELNMQDGYIHGNFNITDQFGAESWEYENGFEVASSHIETSGNYTSSINRQWEYNSDKTKARVSMENNTSQTKGEPVKIEPNLLGANWIEHNGPSKPKINIKTDRFLIAGNAYAQSFNLKTGLPDGLRIGLYDHVLTATQFEQGNLHGYQYFFDRQKAEWAIRDWCHILGVMTWTDHNFYNDGSNCKARFQEPNYKNLAIPEPFKTLIDQDKKKVTEALIKKVKVEKERERKAEIEKKQQEEAERKRRIKAEKNRKAEEKKRQAKFAAERERIEAEFTAPPEKERAEAGAKNEDRVTKSYRQLIQRRLSENWSRPPSARLGMKTLIRIRLVPTGRIVSVTVLKSSGDIAFDRSIEQAALKVKKIVEIQGMDSDLFERKFRQIDMAFSPLGDQI